MSGRAMLGNQERDDYSEQTAQAEPRGYAKPTLAFIFRLAFEPRSHPYSLNHVTEQNRDADLGDRVHERRRRVSESEFVQKKRERSRQQRHT